MPNTKAFMQSESYQHSVKIVRLCTEIMDALKRGVHSFTLTQAVNGETPTAEQKRLEALIDEAGLSTNFFDNSDPLYARAEKNKAIHQSFLNEFKLM